MSLLFAENKGGHPQQLQFRDSTANSPANSSFLEATLNSILVVRIRVPGNLKYVGRRERACSFHVSDHCPSIRSYIVGNTYDKLYDVICSGHQADDAALLQRLTQLQDVSGEKLSLKPVFCCPLPAAVSVIFLCSPQETDMQLTITHI